MNMTITAFKEQYAFLCENDYMKSLLSEYNITNETIKQKKIMNEKHYFIGFIDDNLYGRYYLNHLMNSVYEINKKKIHITYGIMMNKLHNEPLLRDDETFMTEYENNLKIIKLCNDFAKKYYNQFVNMV